MISLAIVAALAACERFICALCENHVSTGHGATVNISTHVP